MTNRTRVQPLPIEVPTCDPFKNDLLDRKSFAQSLAATLGGIEGPGVFAIDGQWGTGKSTFVRMFEQHLVNEGFRVVTINAWETDYADDPLAALVSGVAAAEPDGSKRERLKRAGIDVLKVVAPAAIRAATYGVLDLNAHIEKTAGDALGQFAENRLAAYEQHYKSMEAFKDRLNALAEHGGDKPLVVIIDELDRCRPTYAVEMLETVKHTFDVHNMMFVFALNRNQLDQSATMMYGTSLDPESYFSRFFDFELTLPDGNREGAVRDMLRQRGLDDDVASPVLITVLSQSPFAIRTLSHTIHHYTLVYSSLRGTYPEAASACDWMLPCVLLWRLIDRDGFRAFLDGSLSDKEFVDRLLDVGWVKAIRTSHSVHMLVATAIAAHLQPIGNATHSDLLERYEASDDDENTIPILYESLHWSIQQYGSCFPAVVQGVEMLECGSPTNPANASRAAT